MIYTCKCGKTYKIEKSYNNHLEKCKLLTQDPETIDYKKLYDKMCKANELLTKENESFSKTNKYLRETNKLLETTCNDLLNKVSSLSNEVSELNTTKNKIINKTTNNNNNVNIQVYISLDKKPINPINFKQIIRDLTANTTKILEDHKYDKVIKFDHEQSDMYFLKEKPTLQ